jgi:Leucine-rich repeat (LRR) protein
MKRLSFTLFFCLLLVGIASAQENEPTPYEIALQRIEEAEASGEMSLGFQNLGLTELPTEIGNLTNLQFLYLSDNELTHLPSEIGNLTNLLQLHVYRNQLISLPPEIGNLSNLETLALNGNQLASLPPEIGGLTIFVFLTCKVINFNICLQN